MQEDTRKEKYYIQENLLKVQLLGCGKLQITFYAAMCRQTSSVN